MKKERTRKEIYKSGDSRLKNLHIKCNNCGVDVPFDAIDFDTNLGACYNCKQFFDVNVDAVDVALKYQKDEAILAIPDGVDVIDTDERLDIRYSKFATESKVKVVFLTFFNLMWNGFLFVMIKQILVSGDSTPLLFMSLHIIAGIFMMAWLASLFLNYVDIIVDDEKLTVKTRPLSLPFMSDISIYPEEIDQLYVEKYVSSRQKGNLTYNYKLMAIMKNGKSQLLLKGASRMLCFYLEQSIEHRLGIEDRHVKGQEN